MTLSDTLDDVKFYKTYDQEDTLNAIISCIDQHDLTYWQVACALYNHMINYQVYFEKLLKDDENLDVTVTLSMHEINKIANEYLTKLFHWGKLIESEQTK